MITYNPFARWTINRLKRRQAKWRKRRQAIADRRHGRMGRQPLGFLALAALWCFLAGAFQRKGRRWP